MTLEKNFEVADAALRHHLCKLGWPEDTKLSNENVEVIFACLQDEEFLQRLSAWRAARDELFG